MPFSDWGLSLSVFDLLLVWLSFWVVSCPKSAVACQHITMPSPWVIRKVYVARINSMNQERDGQHLHCCHSGRMPEAGGVRERKGVREREEKGKKERRKQDEQKRIGQKKEVKTEEERKRLPIRGEERWKKLIFYRHSGCLWAQPGNSNMQDCTFFPVKAYYHCMQSCQLPYART